MNDEHLQPKPIWDLVSIPMRFSINSLNFIIIPMGCALYSAFSFSVFLLQCKAWVKAW